MVVRVEVKKQAILDPVACAVYTSAHSGVAGLRTSGACRIASPFDASLDAFPFDDNMSPRTGTSSREFWGVR